MFDVARCWMKILSKLKTCSNEASIVQQCWANNVARCWMRILGKTLNSSQRCPTQCSNAGSMLHASDNVGWCWANMFASFKRTWTKRLGKTFLDMVDSSKMGKAFIEPAIGLSRYWMRQICHPRAFDVNKWIEVWANEICLTFNLYSFDLLLFSFP